LKVQTKGYKGFWKTSNERKINYKKVEPEQVKRLSPWPWRRRRRRDVNTISLHQSVLSEPSKTWHKASFSYTHTVAPSLIFHDGKKTKESPISVLSFHISSLVHFAASDAARCH